MGKFVVIGLGSFGEYAAKSLMERGNEVLVIDKNPSKIQKVKDIVTDAMAANAADIEFLKEADIADVDAVIVGFGESEMAASVLATMHLKTLGVRKIVVKVTSDDHRIILEKVGATQTVFPERDIAERLASSICSPNVYDQIPLSEDFGILELAAPAKFVVEHLEDLNMRAEHTAQVLFIKRPTEGSAQLERPAPEDYEVFFPNKQTAIKPRDILILAGSNEALEKIKNMKPSTG